MITTFHAVTIKISLNLTPFPPKQPHGVVVGKHDFSVQSRAFHAIPSKDPHASPFLEGFVGNSWLQHATPMQAPFRGVCTQPTCKPLLERSVCMTYASTFQRVAISSMKTFSHSIPTHLTPNPWNGSWKHNTTVQVINFTQFLEIFILIFTPYLPNPIPFRWWFEGWCKCTYQNISFNL